MAVLKTKLIWYPQATPTVGQEITDFKSVEIKKGLDAKANTVSIELKNPLQRKYAGLHYHKYINDDGTFKIKKDDVIEVYARYVNDATDIDITTTTDLITTADIIETEIVHTSTKSSIKLTCIDKTYALLSKIWAQTFTEAQGLGAPEVLKNLLRKTSAVSGAGIKGGYENTPDGVTGSFYTDGTGMYEIDARLESEGGFIQDTRPDTTDYPVVSIGKKYKPIYDWIEDLASVDFTNSSTEKATNTNVCQLKHIYFIDKLNRFHYKYPDETIDYNITVGDDTSDDNIHEIKLKNSVFDVVNTVFFSAGKELRNVSVLGYYYDISTKESKLKMKYQAYTWICISLRDAEVAEGNISINEDGTVTILNSSGTTSWGKSYSSESDYEDKFFNYAQSLGEAEARKFTLKRGSPRWKGTIQLRGRLYLPGEVINVTDRAIGLSNQTLRVKDVSHKISNKGWVTVINVEEDEAKLI